MATRRENLINENSSSVKRRFPSLLLNCGDVELHPGPNNSDQPLNGSDKKKPRRVRYPCVSCGKGVTARSKAIDCDGCKEWIHARCAEISDASYLHLVAADTNFSFTCDRCSFSELPFNLEEPTEERANVDGFRLPANSAPPEIPNEFKQKGLVFLHLNVRSLIPKLPEVRRLLAETNAAVLTLSETWLDETVTDGEVNMDGYSTIRRDRNRHGGGVLLYVKDGISYNTRPDLQEEGLEAAWIELFLPKSKGILVSSIYRPPDDSSFLSKLEISLGKVQPSTEIYVLGDFNINYDKRDLRCCKKYTDILDFYNCKQIISDHTRVSVNSSTTLDHIVTNSLHKIGKSGVLGHSFSDHFPIFCIRTTPKRAIFQPVTKCIRSFKNYSKELVLENLRAVDWSPVYLSQNVDLSLESFIGLIMPVIDKVAPERHVRIKQKTEPWMNPSILADIRRRDHLLQHFKRDKSKVELHQEYCKIRNKIQRDVKMAKRFFFQRKVEQNRNDSKRLWSQFKTLGYDSKSGSNDVVLEIDGEKCYESKKVAGYFNSFYTNVAAELVKKLPRPFNIFSPSLPRFSDFYSSRGIYENSFTLSPVTRLFVHKQLGSLKTDKSTGLDGIFPRFLKDGAELLSGPVPHIVNFSISAEAVPAGFKDARVKPLFKKGSKLEPGNYRPVSVLNTLSKILERAVHDQLVRYLEGKNVLYKYQSGFRSKFSTDTCLLNLTDYIKGEMSKGNMVGMVLIDLQKAFDVVNHDILLLKLKKMGVASVDWFRSYLTCRRQCVNVNGTDSDFSEIQCGVPQGSILGPTLFLCYINDLCSSLECRLSLYADDSALIAAGK